MRLVSIILLLSIMNSMSSASLQKQPVAVSTKSVAAKLKLTIMPAKARYKSSEQLRMMVVLGNSGNRETYVLATLRWGISAGLLFHIKDADGREIDPQAFPDDQVYASPRDSREFVKLQPDHFIGTNFYAPLNQLGIERPGKYSIFVEYTPRFSTTEVELHPFWGSENGTIRSNVVYFEVVR